MTHRTVEFEIRSEILYFSNVDDVIRVERVRTRRSRRERVKESERERVRTSFSSATGMATHFPRSGASESEYVSEFDDEFCIAYIKNQL